jgi:hypothetical protein
MTTRVTTFTVAFLIVLVTFGMNSPLVATESNNPTENHEPSFQEDVIPILTRFGCNTGGCHGKLAGQKGFRLSLRGYAPALDHEAITREARGRRINYGLPQESLLIRKANGTVPHGGGERIIAGSSAERTLLEWINAGCPGPKAQEPRVVRLELTPTHKTMLVGETLSLQTIAHYDSGATRDVTWLTHFATGDASTIAATEAGQITALRSGETVVRASYQNEVAIATLTIPYANEVKTEWYAKHTNTIDEKVFAKLHALRIEPAPLCDDATFLRRAYLDAIGTLPTAQETHRFISDTSPSKRAQLIEELLARPEFVDYWALRLGDLLQNRKERDHDVRGTKGVRTLHAWLRQQLQQNRGWHEIASALLTAQGDCHTDPTVGYYIVTVGEKEAPQSEIADSVAQAFLGTRIGCAKCHNHPLEKFTQDDYYHFVSFFSKITLERNRPEDSATSLILGTNHYRNLQREREKELEQIEKLRKEPDSQLKISEKEKRIQDLEKQIAAAEKMRPETRQPRTGKMLSPQPLDRSTLEIDGRDPRVSLVKWMNNPQNSTFSGAMVNRLWKHFFSIGLVEPVDDLRATNPPSNRELWDYLNFEFTSSGYNLRHMMRLMMNSRAYQLSADTQLSNIHDDRFYSHFYPRRLPAEVLLDAISQATGEPETFPGYPTGVRAIQVPDPSTESYFLSLFGRSERTTACACERSDDVTLPQLLHLRNGDSLVRKLAAPQGKLQQLLLQQTENEAIIEELFLITLNRFPKPDERTNLLAAVSGNDRQERFTDLFWALLNSKEFAFQH